MQQKERSVTPQVAEIRSPLLDGALASRNLIECLAISDPRLGDHAYKFNGPECLRAQRVPLPIACNGYVICGMRISRRPGAGWASAAPQPSHPPHQNHHSPLCGRRVDAPVSSRWMSADAMR